MRWWKNRSRSQKLAIALVVLAIAAVGGVVGADRFGKDEPVQQRRASSEASPTPKPSGKPLELGTVARISPNYRVSVEELTLYNFSSGRLMAATIKATYVGKGDGEPWGDLTVKYMGKDSRIFNEVACPFDLGELDASDQATLKPDDVTTYGVCVEVPSGTVEGGRVIVEEALERPDEATSWTTDDAVTKTPPATSIDPGASNDRDNDTSFRGPSGSSGGSADYSKTCEKYEDDMDDYRNGGKEDLEDLADRYEDNPDHDDDKLDGYRKWLKGMEKNAEWFEENC